MSAYLFFRTDGFYPLELPGDQSAKETAELNPGTIRVETLAGKVIWADNNRMIPQSEIGTELFRRMNDSIPDQFKKLNTEAWLPTPFMIDVFTTGREQEIRCWCNHHFGRESSPMHEKVGSWKQSNVTMRGYCWFGFETESLMTRFLAQWPSPLRLCINPG